ncbi:MAG: alpha/beta hydrolase, partial [bacterium]|nr:alpha/beta hydrolase [bacterium]
MTKVIKYIINCFLFAVLFLFVINFAFGAVRNSWQDASVYKPTPALFLHGFGPGNAEGWSKVKSALEEYFSDYSDTHSFLETINFNDPNGSVDTYDSGKLNPQGNFKGWADKLEDKVNELLSQDKYGNLSIRKINLVCHSMGGLAAREYVTNPKYVDSYLNINKIITVGTPHCGTPLANLKEVVVCGINKIIWEIPGVDRSDFYNEFRTNDALVQYLKGEYRIDPNGEAIKDMGLKSQFLKVLNDRIQSSNIKNYAIFGEVNSLVNWIFFRLYYSNNILISGDEIVPIDSQKGYDIFTDYPDASKYRWVWNIEKAESVNSNHLEELNSNETPQKLLSFLDSVKPELAITFPDPNLTTEIHSTSINIKGIATKEYLPADTTLTIDFVRQEDDYRPPQPQTSLLKPSDLWSPNNPDSPVAEFDEVVAFPGNGTYKIYCQVKNPAGLVSDVKETSVKVAVSQQTSIIVHCHNPEGVEISSIQGVGQNSVKIYDGDAFIGYGAYNSETHNKPLTISSGTHTIKATFNGMTKEETVTLNPGEINTVTFSFDRVEIPGLFEG